MNDQQITWEHALLHFFTCFHSLNIRNSNHETYGKAFYKELAKNYEKFLAKDSSDKVHNLWRKGMCVYCLNGIDDIKFSKGDHIVAGLKKRGIDQYNVPCCKSCNSSKNKGDLIAWLLKNGKDHTSVPRVAVSLYIKAQYMELKFSNKLQEPIPEYFANLLKKLEEERDLEELIKFDTGKNRIFLSKQLETFHYLQTEPSEWDDCEIDHWETDEKNNEHPVYRLTSNREVTPFDDRNPMRTINQVYSFDDSLDVNHEHRNNCQLCGTPILVNYRIKCDRLQIDMVLGSECIKSYHELKGDIEALDGIQTLKKAKKEVFLKKVDEFAKNTINKLNTSSEYSEKRFSQKYNAMVPVFHDSRFYRLKKQLQSLTPESSKTKIKALIKKAELYGLPIDSQLKEMIEKVSKKSKKTKNSRTGLDEFFWK